MPEALETWPAALVERVPRHPRSPTRSTSASTRCAAVSGGGRAHPAHVDVDEEGGDGSAWPTWPRRQPPHQRCVSQLHTDPLMRSSASTSSCDPPGQAFVNVTNGITPHKIHANLCVSTLITEHYRRWDGHRPSQLERSKPLADDRAFRERHDRQGGEQATPAGADSRPHRPGVEPRAAARHPGQAHPRVQAALLKRPARHHALQPHSRRARGGMVPHRDLSAASSVTRSRSSSSASFTGSPTW